ncbi:DHH family phosphoesterase [Candidatus Woesearchaeota archaeon]|nr:DHH family phosphoesterase [Candidatus Woesearchaeota archaeon]
MLSEKNVSLLRNELETAKNPLFFYDADGDGLAAFLLLYRIHREGKGVRINTSNVNIQGMRKVEELNPDKIFILDVPVVQQEFLDNAHRPVFWIDHHQPLQLNKVSYFNPRIKDPDAYIPTSRMAWQISENPADMWIAMIGSLADWHLPDFTQEFMAQYPDLLKHNDLTKASYKSKIGVLMKFFFFIQKGPSNEVHKCIKTLTRIKSPYEILNQETAQGKFLWKQFQKINEKYEELLKDAKKGVKGGRILLYHYSENQWSFTANLANELMATYPKKVVIIARSKGGEMKCSLRAQFRISGALEKALQGIEGRGGGHPNACGAVIKEEDWSAFLSKFKEEIKNINIEV